MRKKVLLLALMLCLGAGINASAQATDYCQVYGNVFITDQRQFADFVVYVEEDETFADMVVFKEENRFFADGNGLWHMVGQPAFADHIIFIEQNRAHSDFSIFYTDVQSFAACR